MLMGEMCFDIFETHTNFAHKFDQMIIVDRELLSPNHWHWWGGNENLGSLNSVQM